MGRETQRKRSQKLQLPTVTSDRSKRRAKDHASSEEEDESDDEPCTQFIKQNENALKQCLVYMLARNSSLLSIKKKDIFSKFGEKVTRQERNAIVATLKKNLLEIGACFVEVDNNSYIIVNKFPRNLITDGPVTPERQFLCILLCFIAVNRAVLRKTDLDQCLNTLGICLKTIHPYFGDVSKSISLFEKQCYLKKCLDKDKNISFEWGVRASYEVDKTAITACVEYQFSDARTKVPLVNLPNIISPEDQISESDD